MNKPQQPAEVLGVCGNNEDAHIRCSHCDRWTPLGIPEAAQDSPEGLVLPPVNRWDRKEDSAGEFMGLVPNGEFVRYCDYQDALRRATEAEARVKNLEADSMKRAAKAGVLQFRAESAEAKVKELKEKYGEK